MPLAGGLEGAEVALEVRPVRADAVALPDVVAFGDLALVGRGDRLALAGDLGGDSLRNLRCGAGVDEDGILRLPEEVEEAGRDDELRGVDGAFRRAARESAGGLERGDPAVGDAEVGAKPGGAGAVDDLAAGDEEVTGAFGGGGGNGQSEDEE